MKPQNFIYPLLISIGLAGCKAAEDKRMSTISLCDSEICLVTTFAIDTDGDGVSDMDEKAAGTSPTDPKSRPLLIDLLKMVGKGTLPSFNRRFSEIVALPDSAPDGSPIKRGVDPLLNAPSVPKRDGLAAAGISSDALAKAGIKIGSNFNLVSIAIPKPGSLPGEQPQADRPPPMKVGGIEIALISQGIDYLKKYDPNDDMNRMPDPPPENSTPGGKEPAPWQRTTWENFKCWINPSCKEYINDDPAGNGVTVLEITPADFARVKVKLGSNITPGPETPKPTDGADPIVLVDRYSLIALYDLENKQGNVILLKPIRDPSWNTNFGPRIIEPIVNRKPQSRPNGDTRP